MQTVKELWEFEECVLFCVNGYSSGVNTYHMLKPMWNTGLFCDINSKEEYSVDDGEDYPGRGVKMTRKCLKRKHVSKLCLKCEHQDKNAVLFELNQWSSSDFITTLVMIRTKRK